MAEKETVHLELDTEDRIPSVDAFSWLTEHERRALRLTRWLGCHCGRCERWFSQRAVSRECRALRNGDSISYAPPSEDEKEQMNHLAEENLNCPHCRRRIDDRWVPVHFYHRLRLDYALTSSYQEEYYPEDYIQDCLEPDVEQLPSLEMKFWDVVHDPAADDVIVSMMRGCDVITDEERDSPPGYRIAYLRDRQRKRRAMRKQTYYMLQNWSKTFFPFSDVRLFGYAIEEYHSEGYPFLHGPWNGGLISFGDTTRSSYFFSLSLTHSLAPPPPLAINVDMTILPFGEGGIAVFDPWIHHAMDGSMLPVVSSQIPSLAVLAARVVIASDEVGEPFFRRFFKGGFDRSDKLDTPLLPITLNVG